MALGRRQRAEWAQFWHRMKTSGVAGDSHPAEWDKRKDGCQLHCSMRHAQTGYHAFAALASHMGSDLTVKP